MSTYIAIGSAILSVLGGFSQASAYRKTAERNAETERNTAAYNKVMADRKANEVAAAAQQAALAERRKANMVAAQFAARSAASGALPDNTLYAAVLGRGDYNVGMTLRSDETNIRHSGAVEVVNAENRANAGLWEGEQRASSAITSGFTSAGSALAGSKLKWGDFFKSSAPADNFSEWYRG